MNAEDIQRLSKNVQEWLESERGKQAVERAVHDAQEAVQRLEKARQIEPEDLHRHFTL